ncbi:hypothetical protein IWQ61_008063 [Dispira simplex]|nr:hypothetical protein IWQ61_008063 [Dispira simplex]
MSLTNAISRVVFAHTQREGGGFVVHRALGSRQLSELDPFLMLDHMGPVTYRPREAVGAPDHPHRGFETVTYVLKGAMQHLDSQGNKGDLREGWVQWMTAGSGVIHSEMPGDGLFEKGGELEGFQLWVNLPRKDKMTPPRYQDTPAEKIPLQTSQNSPYVQFKVIAGEAEGIQGPIETHFPITFLDVRMNAGATDFQVPLLRDYNGFIYVYGGSGTLLAGPEKSHLKQFDLGVLNPDYLAKSEETGKIVHIPVTLQNPAQDIRFLVIAGTPLNEPVARYGPFVMNTDDEILQAVVDFQSGRMGRIEGEEERHRITREARGNGGYLNH